MIRVVAANKRLIDAINGVEKDFVCEYSRELYLVVPVTYRVSGCEVYGAKWVDVKKLNNKDVHFFHKQDELIVTECGLKICVGTPESFLFMKNVILENVRTAENMLIAYERVMSGKANELELIAYAHGEAGRVQFKSNKSRYLPKGRKRWEKII